MALSNTATPKYYGRFRDAVIAGEIPVCETISMEMNRIDALIANPGIYYDEEAIQGFIDYCEAELTLTNGEEVLLLETFKLWAEQLFGWYYFVERSVYEPDPDGHGGHYVIKKIKKRLITKQYLIIARGAAKSMYASFLHSFFLLRHSRGSGSHGRAYLSVFSPVPMHAHPHRSHHGSVHTQR